MNARVSSITVLGALVILALCGLFYVQHVTEDMASMSLSGARDSLSKKSFKLQQQELLRKAKSDTVAAVLPKPGRRINIAVCGVDSRVGEGTPHADANHIISILPDSGRIEIISVPRDTPPVEMDLADSLAHVTTIANVRAIRGTNRYLKELAKIAGLPRMHYVVEVGFSQALGIIEFLGYKEPQHTLRVLRSRKTFVGGDYQRVYNQGQFIAQAIRKHFARFDGVWGDLLLRSGLMFVNSNITPAEAKGIIETLRANGFLTTREKDITVRIEPHINIRLQTINFNNPNEVDSIHTNIDRLAKMYAARRDSTIAQDSIPLRTMLWSMLSASIADSARPREIIRRLQRPFEQRSWLQIQDTAERNEVRRWFGVLLSKSYADIGKQQKADGIQKIIQREQELFLLLQQ